MASVYDQAMTDAIDQAYNEFVKKAQTGQPDSLIQQYAKPVSTVLFGGLGGAAGAYGLGPWLQETLGLPTQHAVNLGGLGGAVAGGLLGDYLGRQLGRPHQ
jgi:hypothetical protein